MGKKRPNCVFYANWAVKRPFFIKLRNDTNSSFFLLTKQSPFTLYTHKNTHILINKLPLFILNSNLNIFIIRSTSNLITSSCFHKFYNNKHSSIFSSFIHNTKIRLVSAFIIKCHMRIHHHHHKHIQETLMRFGAFYFEMKNVREEAFVL